VRKNKHLAATVAAAMAVATLVGASAFAETRHSEGTRARANARDTVRRERAGERQRGDDSRNYERRREAGSGTSTSRNEARRETRRETPAERRQSTAETYRREAAGESYRRGGDTAETYRREAARESYRRNEDRGSNRNRGSNDNRGYSNNNRGSNDNRGYSNNNRGHNSNRGYSNRGSNNHRQSYHHSGRITKYNRWNNGYRVWVAGAPYPFFIPLSHWHHDRFRIGLSINLGGYWNPGGYYDYYDGYYDDYRGYSYRSSSRGDLRGVVESVDFGRDTFVVRNEATGSFVTVIARDRYARDVRPGDYVELSGTWTRSGLFSAYDVDRLDYDDRYRD
jgi:hypothetical protein